MCIFCRHVAAPVSSGAPRWRSRRSVARSASPLWRGRARSPQISASPATPVGTSASHATCSRAPRRPPVGYTSAALPRRSARAAGCAGTQPGASPGAPALCSARGPRRTRERLGARAPPDPPGRPSRRGPPRPPGRLRAPGETLHRRHYAAHYYEAAPGRLKSGASLGPIITDRLDESGRLAGRGATAPLHPP